jgi:hypothetical protein
VSVRSTLGADARPKKKCTSLSRRSRFDATTAALRLWAGEIATTSCGLPFAGFDLGELADDVLGLRGGAGQILCRS